MNRINTLRSKIGIVVCSFVTALVMVNTARAADLYVETESAATLTAPMQIASDATASGGKFIYIPNGNGVSYSVPGKGTASYTINIPQNGTYALWGRIIAQYPNDDSFFIQVDSGTNYTWPTPAGSTWHWARVKDMFHHSYVTLSLSAGVHTISVKHREDGAKIDKLFLTDDMAFVPSGLGGDSASAEVCGNGTLEGTEQCDDGNAVSGDGCTASCTLEKCGDTVVQSGLGEICDENTQSCTTSNGYRGTQTCNAQCSAFSACVSTESCGDGTVNGSEQCDDANTRGGDGCSSVCLAESAQTNDPAIWIETENADSVAAPMEIVADTTASGGKFVYVPNGKGTSLSVPAPGMASYTVTIPKDGNYVLWGKVIAQYSNDDSFFVQVDSGTNYTWNTPDGNTWHWARVKDMFQGNITFPLSAGVHTIKVKQREDGTKIDQLFLTDDLNRIPEDNTPPPAPIVTAACGNGVVESPEGCDDGNLSSGDGCSTTCTLESCGDGIVQTGEQCDDHNTIAGDGCSETCKTEFCGDGILQTGLGEQCDKAGTSLVSCTTTTGYTGTKTCSATCTFGTCVSNETCGDGIVQSVEECDDHNTVNLDGCSAQCLLEKTKASLDQEGMARVQALEAKLNNMTIVPTHPRIFLNQENLAELRSKTGQAAWNAVLSKATQSDLISSALGYLMLEQSNPGQALIYANNVFNNINNATYVNWCATGQYDLTPRINVAIASLAFDWAYNGLTEAQRSIIINKLAAAADIVAKKKEIDDGVVPQIGSSACYKNATKGETFHREEWAFYAFEVWPEIALAGHHPDAEAVYKTRWDYRWYWGDAARMEAYVNDGTPFEGYYFGNDGVSWFLPLKTATGINLVDGSDSTWNRDAAYYMLYRFDIANSRETMHKGVATSNLATNSFLKSVTDTWKLREHISRTFSIGAKKDPYLQWFINNKIDRFSSWLMTNNYFGSVTALYDVSKLLFYDAAAPQKDPTTATYAELPFDRHFAGGNEAYMRTGWGPKATIVGFRSKPAFTMTSHSDFDVNTFVIHRDGGPLAPDSGVYDAYEQQRNYMQYQKNTIAHNNLLIINPADPDGPKKLSLAPDPGGVDLRSTRTFSAPNSFLHSVFVENDPTPNWADIAKFETQPGYAYLVGDGKEAYGSRLSKYDRNLAFLRKGNDEGYLIIFDRVTAASSTYKKKWLLHTVNEPVLNGKIIGTQVPGHIETYDGDSITTTSYEGTSKLHAKVLLPAGHSIRRIGGEILHTNGTVNVDYGSDKVVGNGTTFAQVMVGHYFHVNKDKTSTVPSGYDGFYDWYQIKSVEDAAHLTLSRAYTKTALNEPYTINQGYQYWVDGTTPKNIFVTGSTKATVDSALTGKAWQHMGQGRIELMPPDGNKTDYFLVAMSIGDINSIMPANTSLVENKTGDAMEGVLIDNKVVMFGQTGNAISQTSFKVNYNGPVDFMIADLNPGQTYSVRKEGALLFTRTASSQGTISFSDNPGSSGATYSLL
ncbi:MAG: DUF4215 domain-containing protein [Candidatus Omnitrophica bacterium]|nr:DUF4215 domain-containing protein [Candidatus Omnitrophota bacterium]